MPKVNLQLLAATGFFLAILQGARADQAVVVGIQEYKPLVAASTLRGCVNDATGMADALKNDGFTVTLLLNDKATRAAIFGQLKRLEAGDSKQRFVFYYAGHGRKAPRYALMPSDATYDGNDISPKELNDAILKVPARSRTVILDSCFSGGMAAGEMSRGADDFKPRYFDGEEERSLHFGPAPAKTSQKDTPQQLEANSGICYYTASLGSEQALETTMPDGKRHGLFTYALLGNLEDGKLWGDVHSGVKKTMGARLTNSGRTQNPMISSHYIGAPVLDNVTQPDVKPGPPKTLLEVWNDDNPSPAKVALKLLPDLDVIEAGRKLGLEVTIGEDGYLIIFGQVGDHFYQFFPAGSDSAADAAVKRGTLPFPDPSVHLFFDDFGADHLKAMLFHSADAAQAVLDGIRKGSGKPTDIALERGIDQPAYTSRLSVAVGDSLVGGLRLKSLEDLYKKVLTQNTDVSRFLVSRMRQGASGYDRGLGWLANVNPAQEPTLADKQEFMTLLNLAIQEGVLYEDAPFKRVKLPGKLKKAAKDAPTGEKLIELNRAILCALYPKEVNPDDARGK